MKEHQSSVEVVGTKLPLGSIALLCLIAFALSYVTTQKWLADPGNLQLTSKKIHSLQKNLCAEGIRLPGLECSTKPVVKTIAHTPKSIRKESLRRQFARMPDLATVVRNMHWDINNEVDAVRLLTTLRSVELSRHHQSSQNYMAISEIEELLLPIWEEYPDIVAGHACLYCGNAFKITSSLINNSDTNTAKLKILGAGHPRFFARIAPLEIFDQSELTRIAKLQAELSAAGDSETASFIGSVLTENNDYSLMKVWATKGLNGGRSLNLNKLNQVPIDVVVAAWERGVSLGYDTVQLSEYLVAKGHKPALRWVVWLESTDYDYLHDWSYRRNSSQYQSILRRFTAFPHTKGEALSSFYSQNWANIVWNNTSTKWEVRRQNI